MGRIQACIAAGVGSGDLAVQRRQVGRGHLRDGPIEGDAAGLERDHAVRQQRQQRRVVQHRHQGGLIVPFAPRRPAGRRLRRRPAGRAPRSVRRRGSGAAAASAGGRWRPSAARRRRAVSTRASASAAMPTRASAASARRCPRRDASASSRASRPSQKCAPARRSARCPAPSGAAPGAGPARPGRLRGAGCAVRRRAAAGDGPALAPRLRRVWRSPRTGAAASICRRRWRRSMATRSPAAMRTVLNGQHRAPDGHRSAHRASWIAVSWAPTFNAALLTAAPRVCAATARRRPRPAAPPRSGWWPGGPTGTARWPR
jgi:hypothetical protein